MKINLRELELNKCSELLHVKEANLCAAEMYIEYLNNNFNDINKDNVGSSYYDAFLKIMDIDPEEKDYQNIETICKTNQMNELNPEDFKKDEYYKTFSNFHFKENNWILTSLSYEPYEGFVSDEIIVDKGNFAEQTPFSYFTSKFTFPAVIEEDQIWMSVMPHEINTMKEPIKNARGNVLVLGLGLGYYLFHVLNKKEVKNVTVIELDENVISLFNKHLLDKFPHKEKITILKKDAIEYLRNTNQQYDYVFADIWHNVGDGLSLYLKIKQFEKKFPNTQFDYWIETSLVSMLRRQLLTIFDEQLNGSTDKDYKNAANQNDVIINRLYYLTKDYVINSFQDLHDLLEENNIKQLVKNFY